MTNLPPSQATQLPQATQQGDAMTDQKTTRYVGSGEAAELLGVSHDTVLRLVRDGLIPAWTPGGREVRMKRADVLAYLDSVKVTPRAR